MSTKFIYSRFMTLALSIVATGFLTGCEGGLIGTGGGPALTSGTYENLQLRNLPSRIGPRLPASLTNNESIADNLNSTLPNSSNTDAEQVASTTAQNWNTLSPIFTALDAQRLIIQSDLVVLDSIFDTIESQCSAEDSLCQITSDNPTATLTDSVATQLSNFQQQGFSNQSIAASRLDIETLRGKSVSFGQVSYTRSEETLYDHEIKISALALSPSHSLTLSWNDGDTTVSYDLVDAEGMLNGVFLYKNPTDGQQLTYRDKNYASSYNPTLALRISANNNDDGYISFEALLDSEYITGRAANSEGHSYSQINNDTESDSPEFSEFPNPISTEYFNVDGALLESSGCDFGNPDADAYCLTLSGQSNDSVSPTFDHQGSDEIAGFGNVTIENLPDNTNTFDIRSGPADAPLEQLTIYCEGWLLNYVDSFTPRVFCHNDASSLSQVSVIGIDQFGNLSLLENVRVFVDGREVETR